MSTTLLLVYLNQDIFIMLCKGNSIKVIAVKWMKLINSTYFSSGLYFMSTKKPITYKLCTYINSCSGFFFSRDLSLWIYFVGYRAVNKTVFFFINLSLEGKECENSDNNE